MVSTILYITQLCKDGSIVFLRRYHKLFTVLIFILSKIMWTCYLYHSCNGNVLVLIKDLFWHQNLRTSDQSIGEKTIVLQKYYLTMERDRCVLYILYSRFIRKIVLYSNKELHKY